MAGGCVGSGVFYFCGRDKVWLRWIIVTVFVVECDRSLIFELSSSSVHYSFYVF